MNDELRLRALRSCTAELLAETVPREVLKQALLLQLTENLAAENALVAARALHKAALDLRRSRTQSMLSRDL